MVALPPSSRRRGLSKIGSALFSRHAKSAVAKGNIQLRMGFHRRVGKPPGERHHTNRLPARNGRRHNLTVNRFDTDRRCDSHPVTKCREFFRRLLGFARLLARRGCPLGSPRHPGRARGSGAYFFRTLLPGRRILGPYKPPVTVELAN